MSAADGGDNDARVQLAEQLRLGTAEVGEDGVLRPMKGTPLPRSIEYARHLLERAAHEGHKGAKVALGRFDRSVVRRRPFFARWPWWVQWLLILAAFRVIMNLVSSLS